MNNIQYIFINADYSADFLMSCSASSIAWLIAAWALFDSLWSWRRWSILARMGANSWVPCLFPVCILATSIMAVAMLPMPCSRQSRFAFSWLCNSLPNWLGINLLSFCIRCLPIDLVSVDLLFRVETQRTSFTFFFLGFVSDSRAQRICEGCIVKAWLRLK